MAMPIAVPRYTIADLDAFPDDGNRYELLDGVLLVSPAPLPAHELVVQRLHYELVSCLGKRARVFTRGAVQLRPRTSLEPDILVLPASVRMRRSWADITGWWLAVEVSGRGSRIYDRDFKLPAYPRLGVTETWRADLAERCIYVVREPGGVVDRMDDRLLWHPPGLAEPLQISIPELFEDVEDDWT
jgi:Uma2 family endonuclease